MSRVTATAGLLAALLLASGAAPAEEVAADAAASADLGRDGLYLGVNFVYAIPNFDHLNQHIATASTTSPSVACSTCVFDTNVGVSYGFDARIGYRFLRHFAAQVELEWDPSFDVEAVETRTGQGGSKNPSINGYTVTGDLRVYPLTDWVEPWIPPWFQPYVEVGLGYIFLDHQDSERIVVGGIPYQASVAVHNTTVVGRFGGGVDLYIDRRWGVNLATSYVTPGKPLKDFSYVSVNGGFFYRF